MKFDFNKEPGRVFKKRYNQILEPPLVSIITAYYNAAKYFKSTFNSVIGQTFPWFEWIIVDDGSTNEKDVALLEYFAQKDSRIHVYHKRNGGIATARNLAISKATTDIIIIIDADDLMEPTYVEYLYISLLCNPQASWSYTGLVAFDGAQYLWNIPFTSEKEKKENILIVSSAIRKKPILGIGGYSEVLKYYNEDWYLWLRLLANGNFPVQIDQYSFWYRVNTTGVASIVTQNLKIQELNKQLIEKAAQNVPDGIRSITFKNKRSKEFLKPYKFDIEYILPFNKDKIRILLLLPHMAMGGADKFNLNLIKQLNKKYHIGIITSVKDQNEWGQEFGEYCDDIFNLPNFLDVNDWAAFIHYYIKSRDVKVVLNISSFYGYYIFPWLRKEFPDIGLIDYVHADASYWRNGGYARVSAAFQDVIETTIVANQVTCNIMIDKYGKEKDKCIVSYIGTDYKYFDPSNVSPGMVRNRMNIKPTRPVVLYICRISQEKRPLLMVEVAKELKKKITNVCFLVVGDGNEMDKLRNKITEYHLENTILLAGSQKDVRPYYRDSDVLLITSIKEGLTLTTFEAMSMELPVISADVGGQNEVVNSKTGRLIPCLQDEEKDFLCDRYEQEEVDNYVSALYDFLSNPTLCKETGEYCRKLIKEKFSFDHTVEKIDQIITANVAGEGLERRRKLSKILQNFPCLIDEILTLYCSYESKQLEMEEIWKARNWFKQLYENELSKEYNTPIELVPADSDDARHKLEEIYQMRTWRMIERYRHFMDDTYIGKILRKIRDCFRKQRQVGI